MLKKTLIVLGFALAVWAFCGALVGVGREFMTMDATLMVHAIGAPAGAAIASLLYFQQYGFTNPLVTAAIFVGVAFFLDVFFVALLIEKSFEMFRSFLGVWLPLALIFLVTYVTGELTGSQTTRHIDKGA